MADTELEQLAKTSRNPVQESRYKQLLAQANLPYFSGGNVSTTEQFRQFAGGATGGTTAPTSDSSALIAKQKADEAALLAKYGATISGQETLPAAYTRLSTAAGIPALEKEVGGYQTQIANVQDLLNKLEDSINERTKGTLTTEAQRQRLLASEQYPLGKELGLLGTAETPILQELETARGDVSAQLQLEQAQQAKELLPIQAEISAFDSIAAREMTGYSVDKQNQLSVYLKQIEGGQALDLEKMKEASALAVAEKDYQKALEVQKLKNEQLKSIGKYGGWYQDDNGQWHFMGGEGGGTGQDILGGGTTGQGTTGGGTVTNVDPLGLFSPTSQPSATLK